jgi:hypothetical protein
MPLVDRFRRLWPGNSALLLAPIVAWPAYWLARGETRWEYVAYVVVVPTLALASARTRTLLIGLYPMALLGFLYDAMRFVKNVGLSEASVHVCDLRDAEIRWFGVRVDGAVVTVHDVLQRHATPWLDAVAAVPYGTFLFAAIGFAVFLARRGDAPFRRFTWTFLALNLLGFATYHLYPAAPPWYFHAHGCAVDLAARASEGPNLARVDAMLGISYFRAFYGRSNDVFGAVPSLHVAYPVLMLREGWRWMKWPGRAAWSAYASLMCFAAVYLDHHWILDVLLGLAYALVAYAAVAAVLARTESRAPGVAGGPEPAWARST